MVELAPRDLSLLLDIVIAAHDARSFVDGLDEPAFLVSRLHQNAVIRSLEVIGEAANTLTPSVGPRCPTFPGGKSSGFVTGSSMAMRRFNWIASGRSYRTTLPR